MTLPPRIDPWLVFGFAGQALFASRFLYQWLVSEREGRSVVPIPFWWLSLAGGATLFVYAVHRRDPVFGAGQLFGLAVYTRNLVLISRQRQGGEATRPSLAARDEELPSRSS